MNPQPQTEAAPPSSAEYTGSDAVIATLVREGVEIVFGMIGGAIMPVYDALYRRGGLTHVMVGHEQGAAHMADGYARATGRPGVVFTTSGPGATNLVTGLATAMMDSIPMVALTGQVSSDLMGNDAFQEADVWGISMPITKHNYQVTDPAELPQVITEAFYVAQTGRPGPVLIDLPKDVAQRPCPEEVAEPRIPEGYRPGYRGDPRRIEQALELLRKSRRPVIMAGGGVIHAGASADLLSLAETLQIPVTSTLMGLGNFSIEHPLSLGMPGMHGTGYANLALRHCDLLLAVGTRLDDRITGRLEGFVPRAKLVHVDVDASEINKILPSAVPVVGDAKPVLAALVRGAAAWPERPDHGPWLSLVESFKRRFPLGYSSRGDVLAAPRVIQAIGRLDDEAVIVTGVGQHQMFTALYYPFKRPRTFISSGGLGTMGFGLPAALGAKLGRPEATVICVDGDGSFLMNVQELATAVRYRIGVVVVILNNTYLGMVRQWQDMFLGRRRSQTGLECPPYDRVAQAFGAFGRRVARPDDLEPALDWALAQSRRMSLPVVLDVMVDPEAMVLPMVPPGAANHEFVPCEVEEG
jgi:acetolactate synthase-1/2/3 large subunit